MFCVSRENVLFYIGLIKFKGQYKQEEMFFFFFIVVNLFYFKFFSAVTFAAVMMARVSFQHVLAEESLESRLLKRTNRRTRFIVCCIDTGIVQSFQ